MAEDVATKKAQRELLPEKMDLERRQVGAQEGSSLASLISARGRAAGNRSVRVDPEASRIDREDYASWIDSPLNPSNPFFSELSATLEADPRARVALKDKDSDNYNWALNKYVIPLAKKHAALKKQANLTQVSSGYENDQDTE